MKGIRIVVSLTVLLFCSSHAIAQCEEAGAIQIDASSVPFTITASGKYQVVDNLFVPSGSLITIQSTAEDVYLCLSGFQLSAPDVIVNAANTGTLVVRDGTMVDAFATIFINGPTNAVVEDVQIEGYSNSAIQTVGTSRVSFRDNVLTSPVPTSVAIQVSGPSQGTIEKNKVQGSGGGIWVTDVTGVEILNNQVLDSGLGIRVRDSLGCLVADNTLTEGSGGIDIYDSSGCKVYNNVVRGVAANGIDVSGNENLILQNTVSGCGLNGLEVSGSYNQIQENVLNSNGCYGLVFENIGRYNVFRGNTARGNFGLSCGLVPCSFICSEDFCLGEPLTNTSQGDNFMPCIGPAVCNACER